MLPKINLDNGRVFRVIRTDKVQTGEWYCTVSCKGCGKPIYVFDDPAKGLDRQRFVGEGEISTPCARCHADHRYSSKEIISIQAIEDIDGTRKIRRDPSNMPRQPLARLQYF